jgi:hypothetical protein
VISGLATALAWKERMIVPPASPHAEQLRPHTDPWIGHRHRRRRLRTAVLVPVLCAGAALPLAACSSGSASAASPAAIAKTCQQVGAVLSDGPDPDADPVGYAEAQILPLRQVHAADSQLRTAISTLASAYAQFFAEDGKSQSATKAVVKASGQVNKLCPGAAS